MDTRLGSFQRQSTRRQRMPPTHQNMPGPHLRSNACFSCEYSMRTYWLFYLGTGAWQGSVRLGPSGFSGGLARKFLHTPRTSQTRQLRVWSSTKERIRGCTRIPFDAASGVQLHWNYQRLTALTTSSRCSSKSLPVSPQNRTINPTSYGFSPCNLRNTLPSRRS